MKKKSNALLETVGYEAETLYRFYNNFSAEHYPNHWHNAVEIVMPIRSAYKVNVNNQAYFLNEFDILVVPSGELHELFAPDANGQRIILQFDLAILNSVRGFMNASYVYAKDWLITPDNAPDLHCKIKDLLLEMLDETLNRFVYYEVCIINKIVSITLHLTRKQQVEDASQLEYLNKRKEQIAMFNSCIDYIRKHYMENLTLDVVSHVADFSKYHFSRWFQQFAGVSFYDYLTKIRLEKAEAMLLGSTVPITEIGLEAGFQSTTTFNRIFKEYKKCTPTEYRNFYYLQANTPDNHLLSDIEEDVSMKSGGPIKIKMTPGILLNGEGCLKPGASRTSGGTFTNPFIWADVPDPDVIRVGDVYYMSSTTMYFTPGCPIMKSGDMVNWKIINYVYDILDDGDAMTLRNGAQAYGKGSWASSLRYCNNKYYVTMASFTTNKTYIFQTENIESGPWHRFTLDKVYYDPSLLFDDGRVYLVYGHGTIKIVELTKDAAAVKPNGLARIIIEKADAGGSGGLPAEGSHFYKINGKYYLFLIAWPPGGSGRRIELCYRADRVEGPYEGKIVLDDNLGFLNMGVAQGGIVDTPDGRWYAMLFQDRKAVGRVPVLAPVFWEDGWPVFGVDGRVPEKMALPATGFDKKSIIISDEFYQESIPKNYKSENDRLYRYGHMVGYETASDGPPTDTELIVNGQFADGISNWSTIEIADISLSDSEGQSGEPVLFVSDRATTASGPKQDITGKVTRGGVYEVIARVKYLFGPDFKDFYISIYNGTGWESIRNMGMGRVKRGEWGVVQGTYTLPENADLSETILFIETPWTEKPKKELDLMDFYVKSVSMIAKPLRRLTSTMPGENDSNGSILKPEWQWNHNPDNNHWSLTERTSYLRLKAGYLCSGLLDARNTLTQRTFGPECAGTAAIEVSGMRDGDVAGLAALQEMYGYVGVKMVNGKKYVVMVNAASEHAQEMESVPLEQDRIYFGVEFDFSEGTDKARFFYSLDEIYWLAIGSSLPMTYLLTHFTGYRFALFYYATQLTGGFVDFDYFRVKKGLLRHEEEIAVLNAAFDGEAEVLGVSGAKVEITVKMDPLPEGGCLGLYVSIPVPAYLSVENVAFCTDNIIGNAAYACKCGRLQISLTGEDVSFTNKTSDLFAVLRFKVNGFVTEDTIVTLRPDYIYADGSSSVYDIQNTRADIKLTAVDTNARAKKPGYGNPLISHKYGADPYALEYGGRVYMYLTGDVPEYSDQGRLIDNTYSKINKITVISSSDLVNWTDHGEIVAAGPAGAAQWAAHSWAPAVAFKTFSGKDRFFLYFANDASNIGVLTADTPVGPWTDPLGHPLIHRGIPGVKGVTWCFDPAVLVDNDGSGYLYFGGGIPSASDRDALHPKTARVIRLGDDMISTAGEAVTIDAPAFFEDSGINSYKGKYYYSYCSNVTGNHPQGYPSYGEIAYMVGDNPMGPFAYAGTILKNSKYFFRVGGNNHHCLFTFHNQWFIAYHAQTLGISLGKVKGYRSPHINALTFYEDGHIRPIMADMKGVSVQTPLNPYQRTEAETVAWHSGISTALTREGGMFVTNIHDGDWLAVANADFGATGASRFTARVASDVGGEIEIRLDSMLGEIAGTLAVGVSGENVWELKFCNVKHVTGIHNLFFLFRGESERNLFNFDYWMFDFKQIFLVIIAVFVFRAAAFQYTRAFPIMQGSVGNSEFVCDIANFHKHVRHFLYVFI